MLLQFSLVNYCTFIEKLHNYPKIANLTINLTILPISGTLCRHIPTFSLVLNYPSALVLLHFPFTYIHVNMFLVPMVSVVPSPFKQNCLDIFSPSKRKHLLPILLWSKSDHCLRSSFQNINKISKIFRPQYAPKRDFSAVFWW